METTNLITLLSQETGNISTFVYLPFVITSELVVGCMKIAKFVVSTQLNIVSESVHHSYKYYKVNNYSHVTELNQLC